MFVGGRGCVWMWGVVSGCWELLINSFLNSDGNVCCAIGCVIGVFCLCVFFSCCCCFCLGCCSFGGCMFVFVCWEMGCW